MLELPTREGDLAIEAVLHGTEMLNVWNDREIDVYDDDGFAVDFKSVKCRAQLSEDDDDWGEEDDDEYEERINAENEEILSKQVRRETIKAGLRLGDLVRVIDFNDYGREYHHSTFYVGEQQDVVKIPHFVDYPELFHSCGPGSIPYFSVEHWKNTGFHDRVRIAFDEVQCAELFTTCYVPEYEWHECFTAFVDQGRAYYLTLGNLNPGQDLTFENALIEMARERNKEKGTKDFVATKWRDELSFDFI